MSTDNQSWAPEACTLPTADRPLRRAEFDELFAHSLRGQERTSRTELRWLLDGEAEDAVRDLTARDSSCCSFFSFTITPLVASQTDRTAGRTVVVDVEVPVAHVDVLDALHARAEAGMTS